MIQFKSGIGRINLKQIYAATSDWDEVQGFYI